MTRKAKRIKRFVRRPFEWMGILLALGAIVPLPRRAMLKLCDFISFVMYMFDSKGRARANSNLGIMFPMIISLEELVASKAVLEECRDFLPGGKIAVIPEPEARNTAPAIGLAARYMELSGEAHSHVA